MGASRTAGWVIGTVVLVLALLAGTWFLLAAPRFEAAADTMLQTENSRAQNDLLQMQNARLKADFDNLEAYKAEVATLQVQIPATAALPAYSRTLADLATANGVALLDVAPGAATLVVVPVDPMAAPPQPPVEEGTEPSTESETGTLADAQLGTAEPAAPVGPVAPEGLVAVPFAVKVLGTYEATNAFLAALQTGTERLFLVTQVDAAKQEEAEASASKPATAEGDVELTITGFTYVLPSALPTAPSGDEGEVAPVPLPTSDRNPFAPLSGAPGGGAPGGGSPVE
jgi:Tfp pilus assembly protein PilO